MITDENSKSHPSFPLTLHGVVAPAADSILSDLHLALHAAIMPLHADMLAVCEGSINKIRSDKRAVARYQTDMPMPPLGRLRLRPGAVVSEKWRVKSEK